MNQPPDNLDALLRLTEGAALDRLTPEEVERLEARLNSQPALAARLAGELARPEPRLAEALRVEAAGAPAPSWEAVEDRIAGSSRRVVRSPRRLFLWLPLATAAAAALMFAVVWPRMGSGGGHGPAPWPLQMATHVQFDELEVFGNAQFVIASVAETDVNVIWVIEDES